MKSAHELAPDASLSRRLLEEQSNAILHVEGSPKLSVALFFTASTWPNYLLGRFANNINQNILDGTCGR